MTLADLPPGEHTEALLPPAGRPRPAATTRTRWCWSTTTATAYPPERGRRCALRRARSTRISIDGNAHFCRGLLRTRYPGSDADQAPRHDDPAFVPLTTVQRPAKEHTS